MVSFVTITNGTVMPTSSIGYWCSIAAHQYFARLQEKLEHLDITHWFYVLLTIEEGKGELEPAGAGRPTGPGQGGHDPRAGPLEREEAMWSGAIAKATGANTSSSSHPKAKPAVKAIRKGLRRAER
jgi:hypothetical protein